MKTIEEKAKAYDLAVKRIKNEGIIDHMTSREIKEFLFPDLVESEDEKIKNLLYCLIRDRSDIGKLLEHNGVSVDMVLAWLEKQGEKKPTDEVEPKFKVGDVITFDGYRDKSTIAEIDFDNKWYSIAEDKTRCILFSEQDNWKLVAQKDSDWSEEDEKMRTKCAACLGYNYRGGLITREEYTTTHNWLNSLKEGHAASKTQEWTKTDECMCNDTIQFIEKGWTDNGKSYLISWLKSLKDRILQLQPKQDHFE